MITKITVLEGGLDRGLEVVINCYLKMESMAEKLIFVIDEMMTQKMLKGRSYGKCPNNNKYI